MRHIRGDHEGTATARERGAGVAEYVVMVGLIAITLVLAVGLAGDNSRQELAAAGEGIGGADASGGNGGPGAGTGGGSGGGGTGGGSGGGSGGGGSPTPTTAPPTTAPPTTTAPTPTTAPPGPTTTLPPPTVPSTTIATTTTTAPATTGGGSFSGAVGVRDNSTWWHAEATLTVRTDTGTPVPGASVVVQIRSYKSDGSVYATVTEVYETDASGQIVIESAQYRRGGGSRVDEIEITIDDMTMPPGYDWNGASPTTTVIRV